MKRVFPIREMKYDNMIRMNQTLHKLVETSEFLSKFIFDFNNLKWIDPSGAVLLLETIENLREKDIFVDFIPLEDTSKSAISYGINIGIFQKLGLSEAVSKEEGDTYLAPKKINRFDVQTFLEEKKENFEYYFEYISEKISKKVLRYEKLNYDDRLSELFSYVIRELIRNIFDHSESEYFYYGSQFIPSTSIVELVIADRGLGLKHTVPFDVEERWLNKDTTEHAIIKAFTPGITAASNHAYASEDYLNSGYGLAMVKRLVLAADGILSLATSDRTITFSEDNQKFKNCEIQGTIIRIRVDLEKLSMVNFEKQLMLVEREAKSLGATSKPSRRSKTLKKLT